MATRRASLRPARPVEWQGRQRSATALASSPPRNATITGRRVDRSAALLRMAQWPVGSGFLSWPAFRSGL